jgi:hypothetical protein
MRIPKKVLIIGEVEFIVFAPKGKTHVQNHHFSPKDPGILATNSHHTEIYIFPNRSTGIKRVIADRSGDQSGFIHTEVSYEIPAIVLQHIGAIHSVQYRTRWWGQENETLQHIFENPPKMYAEKYTRFKVIGIKSLRGRIINDRGITG